MAAKFETTNTDEIRVLEGNEIDHVAGGAWWDRFSFDAIIEQLRRQHAIARKWRFPTHRF